MTVPFDVSPPAPHALGADSILPRLGLPHGSDWRMVTLGPIGPTLTPRFVQRPRFSRATVRHNGGGGGRQCDGDVGAIPTPREYRRHLGYTVELFGLKTRPPVQARYEPTLRLWVLAALAYRRADGPSAAWSSVLDGPCDLIHHFSGEDVSAADHEVVAHCEDLVLGRFARPGRRPRYTDPSVRMIAAAAEARKAQYPGLSWETIARSYGVTARTLLSYRIDLAREHAQPPLPLEFLEIRP